MTGAELRAAREAAGITQAQLADRIGRGLRTVNRWENDRDARIPHVAVPAVEAALTGRTASVIPPERLSDQLEAVADGFEADGSAKLAKHLRRLAAAHRAMDGNDDPVVDPLPVSLDA